MTDFEDLLRRGRQRNAQAWKETEQYREHCMAAVELFRQAVVLQPDDVVALTNLGAALCDAAKSKEALEHLLRAEQLGGQDRHLLFNIGVAMIGVYGPNEDARAYFLKAHNYEADSRTFEAYIDFHAL